MTPVIIIAGVIVIYLVMTRTQVRAEVPGAGANLLKEIYYNYRDFAGSVYYETGVPLNLILAIIRMESAGDAAARGSIGEVGLMQLTEGAWEDVIRFGDMTRRTQGIPRDPYSNILAGAKYLVICNERMGGSIEHPQWFDALRAYNVGSRRAQEGIQGTNYASKVESFQRLFERGF